MSCRIVVIVDQSGSMDHKDPGDENTYLQYAQSDASTFINVMVTGDSLGVVAFNDKARILVGGTNSLKTITGQAVQDSAVAAIKALVADGTTDMVAALKTASAMMPGKHGVHDAEVFLSDGYHNAGGNPLDAVNATPLIYTIALGPASNTWLLDQMATKTKVVTDVDGKEVILKQGKYHFAPNGHDLADIYNTIASEAGVAKLVAAAKPKPRNQSIPTYATVPTGATQATFAINWDKQNVVFTAKSPDPNGKQVNISLYGPTGQKINAAPAATGAGFAVFKIPNPAPGVYNVETWYCGDGLLCNVAAFDNNSDITAVLAKASPATIDFRLADGGDPIDGAQIEVSLESPLVTLAEAAAAHAARLKAVSVSDDIPAEHHMAAKIAALQSQTGEDLLPRRLRPIAAEAIGGGLYRLQIPSLEKAGSHTVRVVAKGYSAKSNTQFQRTTRLSFIA